MATPHAMTAELELHPSAVGSALPAAERASDLALVKQAMAGDTRANRQLIDKCLPIIYSVMRRMGLSAHDAEDVAQDAIVKLLQSLHQFRGDAKLSTWVFTLARRIAIDFFRSRHHRESTVDFADPDNQHIHAHQVHTDNPGAQRDADKLTTMLSQFSEPMRSILLRFYLADETVSEIAEAMQIPEGTIKTHLYRGRTQLRAALETTP